MWLDGLAYEALSRRPARERSAFARDAIAWYAGTAAPLERLVAAVESLAGRVGTVEARLASLEAALVGGTPTGGPVAAAEADPALEEKVAAAIDRILDL